MAGTTRGTARARDRIDAIRRGRVCVFKPEEGDILSRPGPRMAEAAQIMARCLREKAGA